MIFSPLSKVKPYESTLFVVFATDPMQIITLVKLVEAIHEGTDPVWALPANVSLPADKGIRV